ncbi:MAG: ABC transporter permease subunit [Deltaproteobacteria bacterium]|nr:ABC transporter permease subunit [Deltaproteobacteria bacterium]
MPDISFLHYVYERLPELWLRTGEHLMLTGFSTMGAIIIGMPLGVLLYRFTWLRSPGMGAVGILQTIPSLAMLAFLLALLQKIGVMPALIALTLYALLPVVRNTLTGLLGVSPEVMEAARGIGMTESQQLTMVRLPLATPVIVAGIRTAAVVGVGIATLSAFIGAGGLGQFINRGLALSNTGLILLGAVPAAILALLVDFCIGAFEWGLRPERKKDKKGSIRSLLRPVAFFMPLLLIVVGTLAYLKSPSTGFGPSSLKGSETKIIRIGTKNFTEQLILGECMAQLIESMGGFSVERRFNLGGTMICHQALVQGEIDLYAEYTGTALTAILQRKVIPDPVEAYRVVSKDYSRRFKLKWLPPFGFNNTYAITVAAEKATQEGWKTISDLGKEAKTMRAGFTAEFVERPDGYIGLSRAYSFQFGDVHDLDPALMYKALANGEVDVISAFATDGRILAYGLKKLEDDLHFFPPYRAAPVIREALLRDYPEILDVLSLLGGCIDDRTMQRLNLDVDGKKKSPAEVAAAFLREKGLLQGSKK